MEQDPYKPSLASVEDRHTPGKKRRLEPFIGLSLALLWLALLLKVASAATYLPGGSSLEQGTFNAGYLTALALVLILAYVLIRFLVTRWHRLVRWALAVWVAIGWYFGVVNVSEAFSLSALGAILGILAQLSLTAACLLLFIEPAGSWLNHRRT